MADLLANTNFVGAIQNFVTRQICLDLSLSLHFNGHFPGGPGLAGTRMNLCKQCLTHTHSGFYWSKG